MSLSSPMNSDWNRPVLPGRGFPIRKSPDQSVFAAPRSLSQLTTSFVAYWCQGIHHALLINLTKNILANSSNNNSVKNCIYPLYAIVKEPSRFLTGKMVLSNSADGDTALPGFVVASRSRVAHRDGGRAWSRTRDLVLSRDAL